jgi:hypothetical protein
MRPAAAIRWCWRWRLECSLLQQGATAWRRVAIHQCGFLAPARQATRHAGGFHRRLGVESAALSRGHKPVCAVPELLLRLALLLPLARRHLVAGHRRHAALSGGSPLQLCARGVQVVPHGQELLVALKQLHVQTLVLFGLGPQLLPEHGELAMLRRADDTTAAAPISCALPA